MNIEYTSERINVVRCYECKSYDAEYGICKFFSSIFNSSTPHYVSIEDYCSWGMKENGST